MVEKPERRYWLDTVYDRLDRQRLVELVTQAGYPLDEDDLALTSRSELIDLLLDAAVEAEYDAESAHEDYPLRRPVRTPVPTWLVDEPRRVHVRWVEAWRAALGRVHSRENGWDVPRSAVPGDVVVTVLGCRPPVVAALERVEQTGGDPRVRDRTVIAQPVTWDALWYAAKAAAPDRRSARLSRKLGLQLIEGLREELENPDPTFVSAGDCTWYRTSPTAIDALAALQSDHPDGPGGGAECASCGQSRRVELHFERPVHENVQLEMQDHLDDVVYLCPDCHRLAHPHSIKSQRDALHAQRRLLQPECPACGGRAARRVVWGLPSPELFEDPDVVLAGCVIEDPFPAQWRCTVCGEESVTVTTAQLRRATPTFPDREDGARAGLLGDQVRIPSDAGAALTLHPVPEPGPQAAGLGVSYDVGLLSPDREVRYLRRRVGPDFTAGVARLLWAAAQDAHPEQSVEHFSDPDAGFTLAILGSDDASVTVKVTVIADLEVEVPDYDGLAFDVYRADLIIAAHQLRALLPDKEG